MNPLESLYEVQYCPIRTTLSTYLLIHVGDTGCECMVVIGQKLLPLFLREAATVPFNLMGVGQAHLEGGK